MKEYDKKLSRKQEIAILSLLTAPNYSEVAKTVGIGETTLWRWLQNPDFVEEYRRVKAQAVGQAIARLQQTTTAAVNVLADIMMDTGSKDSARVTAARIILEFALRAVEFEELQAKLDEMEQRLEDWEDEKIC